MPPPFVKAIVVVFTVAAAEVVLVIVVVSAAVVIVAGVGVGVSKTSNKAGGSKLRKSSHKSEMRK